MSVEKYEALIVVVGDPATSAALPAPVAGLIGYIGVVQNPGVADSSEWQCAQLADGSFTWKAIGASGLPNPITLRFRDDAFSQNAVVVGDVGGDVGIWMAVVPDPSDAAALTWFGTLHGGVNGGTADLNWQMGQGFNQGPSGPQNAALPSGGWRYESHYQPAAEWIMENHVAVFIDPAAPGVEIRAFDASHNFSTHRTFAVSQCDGFQIQQPGGGAPLFDFVITGGPTLELNSGASIAAQVNNSHFLTQLNAAGNQQIPLIFLDNADVITIGDAGHVIAADGDLKTINGKSIFSDGDFIFNAGNGAIKTTNGAHTVMQFAGGDVIVGGGPGFVLTETATHIFINPTGMLGFFGAGGSNRIAGGGIVTVGDLVAALQSYGLLS